MTSEGVQDSVLPYCTCGRVVKGFGRGSKELGIPTGMYVYANTDMQSESGDLTAVPPTVLIFQYFCWKKIKLHIFQEILKFLYGEYIKIGTTFNYPFTRTHTHTPANFPEEVVEELPASLCSGVYYGWARVDDGDVHKMVMSVGWNPQYQNEKRSMVHTMIIIA